MIRIIALGLAAVGMALSGPAAAQPSFAESGWRASTSEEERLRETFEDAQDDWNSSRDGEDELYDCVMRWAAWSSVTRSLDSDLIPAVSGELMHSYADGHMSHHLSTLIRAEGGNAEAAGGKLALAAQRFAQRPDESVETMVEKVGKCHVPPQSWSIMPAYRMTGPQLLEMLGDPTSNSGYPVFVKSPKARAQFDELIMDKNFAAAANFAAELHGRNDKTTVMWNEVLRASLLSVWEGRGTELSEPLLTTLSQVWWPRYRRSWATNLLRAKRGLPPAGQANRHARQSPGREPGWVTQERERFLRGETNYTPCNAWYTDHC